MNNLIKPFVSDERKFFQKDIGGKNPFFLIAGPCVMESRDLLLQVAQTIAEVKQKYQLTIVFKASFDKANRSSHNSFRGPGMEKGLHLLEEIGTQFSLPILTDIHESSQAEVVAQVADVLQIPAFLCRQSDLLIAAAQTKKWVNVKKGQFMAPQDVSSVVNKIKHSGNDKIFITERGYTFGYNNLVVDMRGFEIMRSAGAHVIFDVTHSTQLPGGGEQSGGQREMSFPLARAAVAAGVDGLFMEIHPTPEKALSDSSNQMRLSDFEETVKHLLDIDAVVKGR